MSDFWWRHFQDDVILWAVRWYCRYGISYRDLEQMWEKPTIVNTAKVPTYGIAIVQLKAEGKFLLELVHWQLERARAISHHAELKGLLRRSLRGSVPEPRCRLSILTARIQGA